MRKRWSLWAALLLGTLWIVWLSVPTVEPVDRGAPLSHWLAVFNATSGNYPEAQQAINRMGTEAVPYLRKMLRRTESPLARSLRMNWLVLPDFVRKRLRPPVNPNDIRIRAAQALAMLGPKARLAIPDLARAVKDRDPILRAECVKALGNMGAGAEDAAPALVEALKDASPHLRLLAGRALWRIENDGRERNREFLLSLLQNPDVAVRLGAAEVLVENAPATRDLALRTLEEISKFGAESLRFPAAHALIKAGVTGEVAVAACLVALNYPDSGIRGGDAFDALEELGPEAIPTLPHLVELLKDRSQWVRVRAAKAMGYIGLDHPGVIDSLLACLAQDDRAVQSAVLHAFAIGEAKDGALVAPLTDFLGHADPAVRLQVIRILGNCGPLAKDAVPVLRRVFTDWDGPLSLPLQVAAADALGKIGPPAETAIPELTEAMKHSDRTVRTAATVAFAKVAPTKRTEAVARLYADLASSRDRVLQGLAGSALVTLAEKSTNLVAALHSLMSEPDPYIRIVSAGAMLRLEPENNQAIQVLAAPFQTNVNLMGSYRLLSAGILGNLGPLSKAAVPVLADALNDRDRNVRLAVRRALLKIGSENIKGSDQK